jgi:hypothetical protein
LLEAVRAIRRRSRVLALVLAIGPAACGAALFRFGALRPEYAACVFGAALILAALGAHRPKIQRPGPPPEATQSDVEIVLEEDEPGEPDPGPVDVDLGSIVAPAKKD